MFVVFEGGEGAGKSTQVGLLADWLSTRGDRVVVSREPGGTPVGDQLRALLLSPETGELAPITEALLYAADRSEHVEVVIRPALESGADVVCDRYVDSSIAYQGAGRVLSPNEIATLNQWATQGLVPDLTVLLDVDPVDGFSRFEETADRLESEPLDFHQRVRDGFLKRAAEDPDRYLVIDATQSVESIHGLVTQCIAAMKS